MGLFGKETTFQLCYLIVHNEMQKLIFAKCAFFHSLPHERLNINMWERSSNKGYKPSTVPKYDMFAKKLGTHR